jgi:hypothetical protein
VATFRINGNNKQGGNVASYFTTADGRVLHLIAGPVDSATFLREARWVVETWKLAQLEAGADDTKPRFRAALRKAHLDRLRQEHRVDQKKLSLPMGAPTPASLASALDRHQGVRGARNLGTQGRVHALLTSYPLVRVDQVYRLVFERLLNENVSSLPVVQRR